MTQEQKKIYFDQLELLFINKIEEQDAVREMAFDYRIYSVIEGIYWAGKLAAIKRLENKKQ